MNTGLFRIHPLNMIHFITQPPYFKERHSLFQQGFRLRFEFAGIAGYQSRCAEPRSAEAYEVERPSDRRYMMLEWMIATKGISKRRCAAFPIRTLAWCCCVSSIFKVRSHPAACCRGCPT